MLKPMLLFVLIMSLFMPVFAQEDYASLPPCTPEQRTGIIDLLRQIGWPLEINPSSGIPDGEPNMFAVSEVLLVQEALDSYQTDFAANLPACSDGIALRDYLQVRYERDFASTVIWALSIKVEQHGLPSYVEPLEAQWEAEYQALATLPTLSSYIATIGQGGLLPNGFPLCGEEVAAQELAKYDDLLASYETLYPQFVTFMETISGDFDTLFQSEVLAMDAFMLSTQLCAENFGTEVTIVQMMTKTSLAIHLLQLAAFERNYGDAGNADALETLAQQYADEAMALHEDLGN